MAAQHDVYLTEVERQMDRFEHEGRSHQDEREPGTVRLHPGSTARSDSQIRTNRAATLTRLHTTWAGTRGSRAKGTNAKAANGG